MPSHCRGAFLRTVSIQNNPNTPNSEPKVIFPNGWFWYISKPCTYSNIEVAIIVVKNALYPIKKGTEQFERFFFHNTLFNANNMIDKNIYIIMVKRL